MKKKFSYFVASVLLAMNMQAQTVNIHFKNGTTINFHEDLVESIDFSEKTPEPTLTAGEAVDLGLSVMWASFNIGAETPEGTGNVYAWGETSVKDRYDKNNYAYYNSSTETYTDLGSDIGGTGYDAASANLGKGWRMPTIEMFDELIGKCSHEWTQKNGVNGYLFTATNGNSIFIPGGEYWSSTNRDYNTSKPLTASANNLYTYGLFGFKYEARMVRPVISYDDYNGTTDYDDTPVTSKVSAYYSGGSIMSNGDVILSGSKINFFFKNNSDKAVVLTGMQMVDATGYVGNNMLDKDVEVASGNTPGYTITLNRNMQGPKCRFTYSYNHHTYTVEAAYQK